MRNRSVTCVDVEDHVVPITECPSIMPLRDSVCNLQACAPIPVGDNGFSCNGINPCPIISQQGGSLSIRVTGAQNLPDLDGWGAAGGDSDPMVTITITGSTRSSGTAGPVITADAAPTRRWEWSSSNNEMVFGFKETLSTMDVAVWDKDSGLEGADDLLGSTVMNLTACSEWSGTRCSEEGWVGLNGAPGCTGAFADQPCVKLAITMEPLRVTVTEAYDEDQAFGFTAIARNDASSSFAARMYQSASSEIITEQGRFRKVQGGTIVRTRGADNGLQVEMYMKLVVNLPCTLFLFTQHNDLQDWLDSAPAWIQDNYAVSTSYANVLDASSATTEYRAWEKAVQPHEEVVLRGARYGLPGTPRKMYGLVFKPDIAVDSDASDGSLEFERVEFLRTLPQFFLPFLVLLAMSLCFLRRIDYRLDLVAEHLLLKVAPPPTDPNYDRNADGVEDDTDSEAEDDEAEAEAKNVGAMKDAAMARVKRREARALARKRAEIESNRVELVATLFECHMNDGSLDNRHFLRHVWYASAVAHLMVASPCLVLVAWGWVLLETVSPPALGYCIAFVGTGSFIAYCAAAAWMHAGWRLMHGVAALLALSVLAVFGFQLGVVFGDARPLSIYSLHVAFLSLNMVPMTIILFINARHLREAFANMAAVVSKNAGSVGAIGAPSSRSLMGGASKTPPAYPSRAWGAAGSGKTLGLPSPGPQLSGDVSSSQAFKSLVGGLYSVDARQAGGFFSMTDLVGALFTAPAAVTARRSRYLYLVAVCILLALAITTWAHDDDASRNQGIASMLSVVVLDSAVYLLHRGELSFSPGFLVFIMTVARGCIAATAGEFWLVGHSLAFFCFGVVLGREIVGRRLPRMSHRAASSIAYFGGDTRRRSTQDVAGSPEVVLAYLSFCFLLLLLGAVFANDRGAGLPELSLLGELYPAWVFGLAAFLLVLVICSTTATVRALQLHHLGILHVKWFCMSRFASLPIMLAAITEILLVCSALLLMAITGATILVELAVFLPILLVLGYKIHAQWVANDYQLLQPPQLRPGYGSGGDGDEGGEGDEELETGLPDLKDPNVVAGHSTRSLRNGMTDVVGGSLGQAARSTVQLPPLKRAGAGGAGAGAGDDGVVMPVMPMALPGMGHSPRGDAAASKPLVATSGEDSKAAPGGVDEEKGGEGDGDSGEGGKLSKLRHSASKRFITWRDKEKDPGKLTDFGAFIRGKLTSVDYRTIASLFIFCVLVLTMGLVVAATESAVLGHALWLSAFVLLLTLLPVVKYYNTFVWTKDMQAAAAAGWVIFLVTLIIMFVVFLDADVNDELALWTLTILILYPSAVLLGAGLYHWRDGNWEVTTFVKVAFPVALCGFGFWVFLMYVWGSGYWGLSLTIALISFGTILMYLKAWASNEYYLPPNYVFVGRLVILSLAVLAVLVGLFASVNLFYCFSLAFLFVVFRHMGRALSRYLARPPDSPVFLSPFVFPIYGYDPDTHALVPETRLGFDVCVGLGVALMWGVFATVFINPIGVGITITSSVIMLATVAFLYAMSNAPVRIGSAARFIDEAMIKQAAEEAGNAFHQRRHAFTITCDEFVERDRREAELERQLNMYSAAGQRHEVDEEEARRLAEERRETAGVIAAAVWDAEHHMRFRLDTGDQGTGRHAKAAAGISAKSGRSVRFEQEDDDGDDDDRAPLLTQGSSWKRRDDAWFGWREVLADVWFRGEGPFQWVFLWAAPYLLWRTYIDKRPRSDIYNADGSRKKASDVKDQMVDHASLRRGLWYRHEALSREFYEEQRLISHFQVLLLVAAEARVRTEAVLFQKFLREYRFKLMANDVHPPEDIFRTQSYATVDVHLVASWLMSLTPEQRDRFRTLKERFTAEVDAQYEMRLLADQEQAAAADALLAARRPREHEMWQNRWMDFQQRRINRRKAGVEEPNGKTEEEINAAEWLKEVEEQHLYCKPGLHEREYQFHDPEFPHTAESIGPASRADLVEGWRVSTGISMAASLFQDGTDPDDVFQGQLADGWLLSAISILAASGGVADGDVDELVARLFITAETSECGAYIVRFWKNAQWESVMVDDYFPVLNNRFKTTRCAGAAFAYSEGFKELWVPILEKAMAKYYGSYAALEEGYVHHALTDLTGFQSEEVFLAEASRGHNKRRLWNNLLVWRKNHFLLGAGTVLPSSSDRELMESGLVFGAAYVVYDVRQIDGLKLVQLRNPPGDHGEWTGDWGDDSPLWTKRLKAKLGYVNDADDGTFWMSYDDFCLAFRSLYVCRYYDPAKWHELVRGHVAAWVVFCVAFGLTRVASCCGGCWLPACLPSMQTFSGWWKGSTAAGLPTKHNPDCKLWLNPQFSLRIDRPTDICLTLTQSLPNVTMHNNPQPVALYIVAVDTQEVVLGTVRGLPDDAPEAEKRAFAGLGHETGVGGSGSTKARRVRALTNTNVVKHSGKPQRLREMTVYATLQPRMYTILVAPYQRGMEGPFTLKAWTNYSVAMKRLWPPPREGEDGGEEAKETLAEKLAARAERARAQAANAASSKFGNALDKLVRGVLCMRVLLLAQCVSGG